MKFIKVDENGLFAEDVILKSPPEVWVDVADSETGKEMQILAPDPHYLTETPKGFYRPKWDFDKKEWTEGKPQDEIDALLNAPKPITKIDALGSQLAQMRIKGMQNQAISAQLGKSLAEARVDIMMLKVK